MKVRQSRKGFSRILKVFKWLLYVTGGAFVLCVAAGFGLYLYFSKDLPKLDKIEDYRPPVMAEVYDDQGKKIGEFWKECRILTPLDKIPKKLIQGFVASEDDRFFEHSGVDPYGIVRAFWKNFQAGHVVQGASTITQQVTKALLLSPERTYDRKIKEAILATKIERNFSKDQILYIYLNQVFFGNRAYGVAAAARNYFHKELDQLNLAEMAMIVGLAKAPSRFDPLINPERAIQRTHYVLQRMFEEGYISQDELNQAKNYSFKVYRAGTDKDFNLQYAPYFIEHVRRGLQKKYGDQLYTGGWKIYSTGNLEMNQEAQKSVREAMEGYMKRYGYRGPVRHLATQAEIDHFLHDYQLNLLEELDQLDFIKDPDFKKALATNVSLSPDRRYRGVITEVKENSLNIKVGRLEGFIAKGDYAWTRTPSYGNQPWKPAVGDVVEVQTKAKKDKQDAAITTLSTQFTLEQTPELEAAIFSYEPFSGAIKAIVGGQSYEDSEFNRATQALRQPGSSIKPLIYSAALDKGYTPTTGIMDSPIVYEDSPGRFWRPKNYGGKYYGLTQFKNALVNSRNVVTVRILMDIGTHYAAAYMRKLGLTTPIFKYYSMALGANEVTLNELASAYGAFITGGILPNIHFVNKIVDPKGNIIEEYKPAPIDYMVVYKTIDENKTGGPLPASTVSNNSTPHATPTPDAQSNPVKSWEEMNYNAELLKKGEESIAKDDIHLTEYEKKILYGDYIPAGYVITPKTALTMVSILRDVVRAGTGTRALALKKPAAGKTGTTNGETDAWFIGFTPNLVTGVWVGFDEKIRSIGHGATGGHTAAPIWLAYMTEATKHYPTQDFINTKGVDLSAFDTPLQVVEGGGGDAEMGDAGVGTGIRSPSGGGGGHASSAEFFTQDLE